MRALDRKLLRDLRGLWSQALTIALVVASGIGGFLTTLSAVDSLAAARERFYTEARFADLFAGLKRAPRAIEPALRALPGVAEVQATVEATVRITLPDTADPVIGQLIGLDARQPPRLNRLTLRSGIPADASGSPGRAQPDGALPAWVSEAFATTRRLRRGDRVSALVNGRQRTLVVAGVALSPEYIFAGLWGMPDQRGFGVFWVDHEALAAAYDMEGAFNRVAVKLAPGADARAPFVLRAPVAGRVLKGHLTSESTVPAGAPLVEIGDTARLEVVAELLTADALQAHPGTPVRIERWGGPVTLEARVRRVEPAAFTKVSALGVEEQRVNVIIDFTSPREQWAALGDGWRVGVRLITRREARVLKVPVGAVFPQPAPASAPAVFVADGGRARLQPVSVQARNGSEAWIDGGLAEGTAVIVYPAPAVADGVRIRARAP